MASMLFTHQAQSMDENLNPARLRYLTLALAASGEERTSFNNEQKDDFADFLAQTKITQSMLYWPAILHHYSLDPDRMKLLALALNEFGNTSDN